MMDATAVMEILTEELDLDEGEVGPESTMDDVENWDSLGHLRVCMALERRFGVKIPMDQVGELTSVPALVSALGQLSSAS